MKKVLYTISVVLSSVSIILMAGFLFVMQIDMSEQSSRIKSTEDEVRRVTSAYARFANGRTLNSDYSFWKRVDTKFQSYRFGEIKESEFIRGIAVFQQAFWKKYFAKNNIKSSLQTKVTWEKGLKQTDERMRKRILSRFPVKDMLTRKLFDINKSVQMHHIDLIEHKNLLTSKVILQYIFFSIQIILLGLIFFRRKHDYRLQTKTNQDDIGDLTYIPNYLMKLDDDEIIAYSKMMTEICPRISEYRHWNDFLLSNFSIIKNSSGDKIVSLRLAPDKKYRIVSQKSSRYRYISLSPLTIIIKEKSKLPHGKDSLNEVIKESVHRADLMCDQVTFDTQLRDDVLASESIISKVESSLSLIGTFFKRISAVDERDLTIVVKNHVKRDNVTIFFEINDFKLEPSLMRNTSNFNFSFYPQKIEEIFDQHNGEVSIKNKYDKDKRFVGSEFAITFEMKKNRYELQGDSRVISGN